MVKATGSSVKRYLKFLIINLTNGLSEIITPRIKFLRFGALTTCGLNINSLRGSFSPKTGFVNGG